jgi:hypothetical protein
LKKSRLLPVYTILFAGVIIYAIYIFLGGDIRNGLSLDVLTTILKIEGSTANVSVLLLAVLLAITWFPYLKDRSSNNAVNQKIGTVLPFSMVCVFVLMMFLSYVMEGHGIYYAVHKYELLLSICMIPMTMKTIASYSTRDKSHWTSFGFVVIVLAIFLYDGSLSSGLSYPGVDRSEKVVWSTVAENELRDYPERRVVCLNTSDPDTMYLDYVSYTCNRILNGLQGLEGNNDYEDWTRLGMWLTDTSRLEALPGSFYESLTFIVLDSTFSRKGDETFMRVLESIPWNQVKAVDLDGNVVSK